MTGPFRNILVATDGSGIADIAVRKAGELAGLLGADLTIVTVTEQSPVYGMPAVTWSIPVGVFDDIRADRVKASHATLEKAVKASGQPAKTMHIEDVQPYQGILDASEKVGADLIVMGSHGYRGIEKLLIGSQASKVLSLASIPVLVVKDPAA